MSLYIVYVCHNEHFYLIDDPKEILSIKEKAKSTKNTISSDMFRQNKCETTFDLPIYENISVDDYVNYKDCNIIYSHHNIYDKLIDVYHKFNHQVNVYNIKLNPEKYVVYFLYKPLNIHVYADINYDEENNTSWKDVKALCEKVKIPFKNQSVSSIVISAEENFFNLKRERVKLSDEIKKAIIRKFK